MMENPPRGPRGGARGTGELLATAEPVLTRRNHRFSPAARGAFARRLDAGMRRPHFADARPARDVPDRARPRRAVRLFERRGQGATTAEDFMTTGSDEIPASRVPAGGARPAEGSAA